MPTHAPSEQDILATLRSTFGFTGFRPLQEEIVGSILRGHDVFVIQPTSPPVNENLMGLFIILDALRRASAGRVTAVIPYYGYARKERKTQPREPISAKLVANFITAIAAR